MAKVKCRFCGKQIDKKNAYVIKGNKRNKYYCCYEHSITKKPRDVFYDKAQEVFGKTTNTLFFKEIDEIAAVHGWDKMIVYLEDNKEYLDKVMSKNFTSEYARCRYFSVIFKNNLGDYQMKKAEPIIKKVVEVDMDVSTNKYKKKNNVVGMNDLLNDLLK